MITKTTNRIHFTDLDPMRFEDLCLMLVSRLHDWIELNHFGRTGTDDGIDIQAIEKKGEKTKTWAIQCKRYKSIKKQDLVDVIDNLRGTAPNKILLIIACDLRKEHFKNFKDYANKHGIAEAEIWTASNLEAELYNKNHDLLFTYFGIDLKRDHATRESNVRYSIRMKKKMERDFIEKDWFVKFGRNRKDPSIKFKWSRVYIRSIDDTSYPYSEEDPASGQISGWFKTHLYDFYHNGLELWLSAAMGHEVLMDSFGNWEPLSYGEDDRKSNPEYQVFRVKMIGQIPFNTIVEYDLSGDEYSSEPHIYCKFQFDGEPYEKIYYRMHSEVTGHIYDIELEEDKRKELK